MLLLIAGIDLVRPYLVKVAIDDHITAYHKPFIALDSQDTSLRNIKIGDLTLSREDWFEGELPAGKRYHLVKVATDSYLVAGSINPDDTFEIIEKDGEFLALSNGLEFQAMRLTADDLKLFREYDIQALLRLGIIFLIIMTLGFGLNYGQVYLLNYTGQKIVYDIRQELFEHIEKLSLSFFDGNPVGRLVTRVTNDTDALHEMYTSVLVNLFRDIFMLLGIMLMMIMLNIKLALVCFAVLPLIIAVTIVFRVKAREAYRTVRVKLARINATFAENISGMRIVQIFNQQKRKYKEFDEVNKDHLGASMRELKVFAVFRPAMEVIYYIGFSLLIWFGGGDVLRGTLEFGVLYAFITYLDQFFRPINDLTEKYNILQSAMASAERMFLIIDQEPKIQEPATPCPIKPIEGRIEFKNVWFSYNDKDWVLKDINLSIEPGQTVALVGATGAGKTSIVNLISRFYDIQKGQILLDGIDIRSYPKDHLRKNIGMVLQDVFLFTGTIIENIRLNNLDIEPDKVEFVARHVNAHTFIEKYPAKYYERVTERGSTLSTGQRQLLAFARALAFDPAILVLDEATANIDTETELLIQDALPKLLEGRTNIVVAHRLSTIQKADKIIVLHRGQIHEMGNHQELLAQEGLYHKLYLLQYKEDFKDMLDGAAG